MAAQVIRMPIERTAGLAAQAVVGDSTELDDWGRDPVLAERASALARLRWVTSVGGVGNLPKRGGALIVVNDRRWSWGPLHAALALGHAVDRPVRFAGRRDLAPLGPLAQRIGALLAEPAELAGALRAGEIVVIGASPTLRSGEVGHIDHHLVGAAVQSGTPVLPAVTWSTTTSRRARVEVGPVVRSKKRRRGPLAELELADLVGRRLEAMIDALGERSGWSALGLLQLPDLGQF
jgi:hypothetical protein